MQRKALGAAVAAAVLLITGCSKPPAQTAPTPGTTVTKPAPAPSTAPQPGQGAVTFVQLTEQQWPAEIKDWVELNRRHEGQSSMRAGEFTYVLVAAGEKPSGGYQVTFEKMEMKGDTLEIKATITAPNGPATAVMTYPVGVARIARYDGPIAFITPPADGAPQASNPLPAVKTGPVAVNMAAMQQIQRDVDGGHQPWRLDPFQVALEEGQNYGFDAARGDKFTLVSKVDKGEGSGTGEAVVTVGRGETSYQIKLIQPLGPGKTKIWTINNITETK